MVQKINLYYAYFRFFIGESQISAGLNKYCKEWTKISGIGYNYKEYKCYTINPGGLEVWAGNIQGYITPDRESAFLDGAPSSSIFDQTVIMGQTRVIALDEIEMLGGFGSDALCYFRKITATDALMTHSVNIKSGRYQKIKHPVMYTLDINQTELIKIDEDGIDDNSDVDSYEIMVDIDRSCNKNNPDVITNPGVLITNLENMMNTDGDNFCKLSGNGSVPEVDYVIFDMLKTYTNIGVYGYNHDNTSIEIAISEDGINWGTYFIDTGFYQGAWSGSKLGTSFRFVKFHFYSGNTHPFEANIRMMITT